MILTPFGDLQYDDDESLKQWQSAHDQQHRTERLALLQMGVPLTGLPLMGAINEDWFGRHMLMHVAYEQYFTPGSSSTAQQLAVGWKSEQSFYDWHQTHDQLHERFGSATGINSTQPSGYQAPIVTTPVVTNYALLLESGSYLLQENGSKILL